MDTSIREVTSEATVQEKTKLRKELRLLDMVFFTAAGLIGIDTLGAISVNGGQTLTWLLISAITFLIPYGLLTAELGSTFPQEGGFYEWCKLAGGRFYASLASMFYWISNPLWVGGTLSVVSIVAIKTFWFGNPQYQFGGNGIADACISLAIALVFIWGTIWCSIISLHRGKWLFFLGLYTKLGLLAVFILLAIVYGFSGQATGQRLTFSDLLPGSGWLAILPLLIFNWSGCELQNGAGDEMRNPRRDVPLSLIRAGALAVIVFCGVVAAIMFTVPKEQLSGVSGFISAYQIVAGVLPGPIATMLGILIALGIVVANASSGGTWLIGADRTYAIATLDRTAPMILGRFSTRYGTPIAVNIMSGIVASITMAAAIILTSVNGGTAPTLFSLVLGFALSTTVLSYAFLFPAYLILRYKYPHVRRPYQVPGGMIGAWMVTLLTFGYAAVATISVLYPTDITASGLDRFTYELTQLVPLSIVIVLTIVFYIWGHAEKRNKDVMVELNFTGEASDEVRVGASVGAEQMLSAD
jgi:amino acid transporter